MPPGCVFMADRGFTVEWWLLKPYAADQLDRKRRYFNFVLSSTRVITENAFGLLKGR